MQRINISDNMFEDKESWGKLVKKKTAEYFR